MSVEPIVELSPSGFNMSYFFTPKTVAVVGATERSDGVGRYVLTNVKESAATIYPVNPQRTLCLGLPCYPTLSQCPTVPELAIIIIPAPQVPEIVREAVTLRIPAVTIISSGFSDFNPQGVALEEQIRAIIHQPGTITRVLGPSSYGTMTPKVNFNSTFSLRTVLPGNIAFISQSPVICSSIVDWALDQKVGFSYFACLGLMIDINWVDFFEFFKNDPETKAILVYMEDLVDPRNFIAAAREVSLTKPIIVLKGGRVPEGLSATSGRRGFNDSVFDALLKRAGIVRVNATNELFDLAQCLCTQPVPKGPRLMIATHAGGPGVLATDTVCSYGGELAPISPETMAKLSEFLPPTWSHANPIDMIGSATPSTYARTMEIALQDPNSDGILAIAVPVAVLGLTSAARVLKAYAKQGEKPIFVCIMGGDEAVPARELLQASGIPTFQFSDDACRMFCYMWEYKKNMDSLCQIPHRPPSAISADVRASVEQIISAAAASHRTELESRDVLRILDLYKMPIPYFVPSLSNVMRDEYNVTLRANSDPSFGPYITFGTGGDLFDVINDTVIGFPPLNAHLALEMVKGTKAHKALSGVRGQGPVDFDRLIDMIVAFSFMIAQHPRIKTVVLDPIACSDRSIVIKQSSIEIFPEGAPIPLPSIRPYPFEYTYNETLSDGTPVTLRCLRPEDNDAFIAFHQACSDETVRSYFHTVVPLEVRTNPQRLKAILFADYSRQCNMICQTAEGQILGLCRLIKVRGLTPMAKIALVIRDDAQHRGIGRMMVQKSIDIARAEGFGTLVCQNLKDAATSRAMTTLYSQLGFECQDKENTVLATLTL